MENTLLKKIKLYDILCHKLQIFIFHLYNSVAVIMQAHGKALQVYKRKLLIELLLLYIKCGRVFEVII